jgi:hypothetical protein
MEGFPPICKQEPLDVQMYYIQEHFALTGKKIRLEDVPKTIYGGALPVAKSIKSKRKATFKEEYSEAEKPSKKAKNGKASEKLKIGGCAMPSIEEEVEDLDTDVVLNRKTRSGKTAASSTVSAPERSQVPKRNRKPVIRKLKESTYVIEESEGVETASELVTREARRKRSADPLTLAKIRELVKGIEVHSSCIVQENASSLAQEAVKVTEDLQELASSEAMNLMMMETGTEDVREDIAAGSKPAAPESTSEADNSVKGTQISEPSISISPSSSSTDSDDITIYTLLKTTSKGQSSSSKLHKKPLKPVSPFNVSIYSSKNRRIT